MFCFVFVLDGADAVAAELVFAGQHGWFEDELVADEAFKLGLVLLRLHLLARAKDYKFV